MWGATRIPRKKNITYFIVDSPSISDINVIPQSNNEYSMVNLFSVFLWRGSMWCEVESRKNDSIISNNGDYLPVVPHSVELNLLRNLCATCAQGWPKISIALRDACQHVISKTV